MERYVTAADGAALWTSVSGAGPPMLLSSGGPGCFVWFLNASARRFAERAADDLVLSSGVAPSSYVGDLLVIAREATVIGSEFVIAMAGRADITGRIEMILNPKTPRRPIGRSVTFLVVAIAVVASVPFSAYGVRLAQAALPPAKLVDPHGAAPQLELDCAFYNPTVIPGLDKLGVAATDILESWSQTATRGTTSVTPPTPGSLKVSELDPRNAALLKQALKSARAILSEPVLRTLSGQPATLETSMGDRKETLEVTLTLKQDRSITVKTSYHEAATDGTSARAFAFTAQVRRGKSIVVQWPPKSEEKPLSLLISAKVVEDEKPIRP